jgi:hypothetical protein
MNAKETKTLHLTLKKKWFYMILSGEKKEEYREIKKYWGKRLLCEIGMTCQFFDEKFKPKFNSFEGMPVPPEYYKTFLYETITFKNGYAADAPEMVIELKGITVGLGLQTWGAEKDVEYFVLSLGEILSTKNIKQ